MPHFIKRISYKGVATSLSATHDQMFSMGDITGRPWRPEQQSNTRKRIEEVAFQIIPPGYAGIECKVQKIYRPLGTGGSKFITRKPDKVQLIRVPYRLFRTPGRPPKRSVDKPALLVQHYSTRR
ncbi:hypothetical protein TNCV_884081 [Trichonephila clavipes]|nr:hypothetical protein TNCV_884081 [Trichonephila clavipes]